jgi:4-amino-4-deoxy-L-arabinose transferase-like glycosyltransferase
MVVVAFGIRLVVMGFLYPARLNPTLDHWKFAGETGRIARSLVEGKGYSSPFFADTGPTAWLTPGFPYLLAGVSKVFGIYTKASALAILSLDCLFSALTCIPVFFIARTSFGERAALWAGWIWAFFPYSIHFAASFIWDTTLTTLLLAILFLIVLNLERSSSLWVWLGFGLLAGFASLVDPVVMSVLPFLTLWILWRLYKKRERWFLPGAAALLGVLIFVSPWFVRNYRTFHEFVPFRTNLGVEFYSGNNANDWDSDIRPPGYHPSDNEKEWLEYQQLGEVDYIALKKREAFAFISGHRAHYAAMCVRRAIYIWTGFWSFSRHYLREEPYEPFDVVFCTALTILALLGLRRAFRERGAPTAMPYVIVFFFFPLVYYLTHPEDYYRRPIDSMLVVLSAYAVASWHPAAPPSVVRGAIARHGAQSGPRPTH